MYDLIILGATFAAAGIAQKYKKNCLILESTMQAGGEFFGALHFGSDFDKKPKNDESKPLWEKFRGGSVYGLEREIYPYFNEVDILFGIQLVSVQKGEKGFVCLAHGVEGFCTFEAKKVIDTRASEEISISKTFNLLIESREDPLFEGTDSYKVGFENHYVVRLPIPLSCGYAEAREKARSLIRKFSNAQKLILLAFFFDYQIKEEYPKTNDGILYLPSKAFENPLLAFDAGLEAEKI